MIDHVVLTAADERYSPPEEVVLMSTVTGDDGVPWVYLQVAAAVESSGSRSYSRIADVPPLRLPDMMRALAACEPSIAAGISADIAAITAPRSGAPKPEAMSGGGVGGTDG